MKCRVSLDDYFKTGVRISLMKIDVEGAELHVLRGAKNILKDSRPLLIVCEARHQREGRVSDVFQYLASLGYRGQFVCRGQLLPISTFDVAVHQRAEGERYWKSEDYCNNFIFQRARTRAIRRGLIMRSGSARPSVTHARGRS